MNPPTSPATFAELQLRYRRHLLEKIVPFWLQRGADREYGGVTNCLRDDGTVESTEKFIWSQGRFLWTLSALCNHVERRDDWMGLARKTADFLLSHGRDPTGAWYYSVSREGRPQRPPNSVYADAFAMYGLTEYARLTGDARALEACARSFRRVRPLLADHSTLPSEPHPIPPGVQAHGPLMILALVFHEFGRVAGDREALDAALQLAQRIMHEHVDPRDHRLYEFVRPGGGWVDSDVGYTCIPGHAVESMWFLERIFSRSGQPERIPAVLACMLANLEFGWDHEYGGILLARHARHGTAVWLRPDAKVWWPHTETLYGLLRGYQLTGDIRFFTWFQRVDDYTFRTFPDVAGREWRHNLDRRGAPIPVVNVNMPVKDPFHLPRALIYSLDTLAELAAGRGAPPAGSPGA